MERQSIVTFPSSTGGANWGPISYNPHWDTSSSTSRTKGRTGPRARCPLEAADSAWAEAAEAGAARPQLPMKAVMVQPRAAVVLAVPVALVTRAPRQARLRLALLSQEVRAVAAAVVSRYRLPGGATVPCFAPPYGALVAVDVNRGEIAWTSALGINESLAEMGDLGLKTGARNLGGNIATAGGLVFIGATNDRRFRAFDAKTGAELWSAELPASGHSTPMTYMGKDGRQYVVIAAGGGTSVGGGLPISDALVAFRLP